MALLRAARPLSVALGRAPALAGFSSSSTSGGGSSGSSPDAQQAAAASPKPGLPATQEPSSSGATEEWTEVVDEATGGTYYWNQKTGETTELGEPRPSSRFRDSSWEQAGGTGPFQEGWREPPGADHTYYYSFMGVCVGVLAGWRGAQRFDVPKGRRRRRRRTFSARDPAGERSALAGAEGRQHQAPAHRQRGAARTDLLLPRPPPRIPTRSAMDAIITATRPAFPAGLRVLLLDAGADEAAATARLLAAHAYDVTVAQDLRAALSALQAAGAARKRARDGDAASAHAPLDVVLADVAALGAGGAAGAGAARLFACAGRQLPVVLMGAGLSPAQVLAGVRAGAADALAKPLAHEKLANLWQHTAHVLLGAAPPASPRAGAAGCAREAKRSRGGAGAPTAAPPLAEPCADERADAGGALDLGLELPPLMASHLSFDPDLILLDLGCPMTPDEPSLDDILLPCSPSGGSRRGDGGADALLGGASAFGGASSDQHGSGATVFGVDALDADADTSSRRGAPPPLHSGAPPAAHGRAPPAPRASAWRSSSRALAPAAPRARPAGLRSCASIRSAAASTAGGRLPAPAAAGPAPAGAAAAAAPATATGPFWGAAPGTRGMVWGLPILSVATAPGLVCAPGAPPPLPPFGACGWPMMMAPLPWMVAGPPPGLAARPAAPTPGALCAAPAGACAPAAPPLPASPLGGAAPDAGICRGGSAASCTSLLLPSDLLVGGSPLVC
ncbi:ARR1 [Scenedesmus sp. PABB004]|nr:ARR1 [Scenedesmus sp. PABB004]